MGVVKSNILSEPEYVLLNEIRVAEILGVSVSLIRQWRAKGVGPNFIKVNKSVRYAPEDVSQFLDKNKRKLSTNEETKGTFSYRNNI